MSAYKTIRNAPVYRKPGGSPQARIGEGVEIQVVERNGGYARFISPVVLENEPQRQWISTSDIVNVESTPPTEPPPDQPPVSERKIVFYPGDGTQEVYIPESSVG